MLCVAYFPNRLFRMTREEISFFDSIAPKWDSMEHKSTPEKVNGLLDLVGVSGGMSVLDLGTGTGVLVPYLSERTGPEGSVTGVDMSEGMLREARRKYGELENVSFIRCDFETDPIEGRYDRVMLYCVYPHLHDPIATIRRISEYNLKPGGKIEIGFPSDERFINGIHAEKKAESSLLPPAGVLVMRFRLSGMRARVLAADPERYLVEIG